MLHGHKIFYEILIIDTKCNLKVAKNSISVRKYIFFFVHTMLTRTSAPLIIIISERKSSCWCLNGVISRNAQQFPRNRKITE